MIRKRSFLSTSIALSLAAFGAQAYAETISVEAELFDNFGGTFDDGQPNPVTIYTTNGQGAISYVNAQDFVDYDITANGGEYTIEYMVGTSVAANPTIEVLVKSNNGEWQSQGTVAVPLGSWDNFQPLTASHTVTLPAGNSTVRLHAIGPNWQWNLESFKLTSNTITNPTDPVNDVVVNLENFTNTGKTGAAVAGDSVVGFGQTSQGINFNTVGDYGDYSVTFDTAGTYSAKVSVGTTVQAQVGAEVLLNNTVVASEYLSSTGGWDTYQNFDLNGDIVIPSAGTYTIRLRSHGAANWQWNGDELTFVYESNETGNANPGTGNPGNGEIHLEAPLALPANRQIEKSSVFYTYPQNSNLAAFNDFGADGAFWGHMPEHDLYDNSVLSTWINDVQAYRNKGLEYIARGEFDWGFRWFTEYTGDPTSHWVRTLDGDIVTMSFMGDFMYQGYPNGWLSNHSPVFVDYFKSQVDALLSANVSHIMFDSQTSSTRSTDMNQFGGDFSTMAMDGFRAYMRDKYTTAQLAAKGINNINNFNYRDFLISAGYNHTTYMAGANRISGGVPLFDDFIYFNREVLNEKMAEVFDYIRSKDANIEIGATTAISEARGYIFDKDLTFLAGELAMNSAVTNEMPISIITHLKGAEAVDKTLVYFPYPWDFANLYDRNSPALARTWIAQSYAMGAIFSIPANIWIGDAGVWSPGADNYRDLYQFADNNSNLLDGYDAYSKVGLVAPMMASLDATWIDGSNTLQGSIRTLIESNLNFDLLVFGDPGHPVVPTQAQLDSLQTIIVDGDRKYLTDGQNALVDAYDGRVLDLNDNADTAAINALKANHISVTVNGAAADATVTALSRVHESNNNAPYVVQLLNRPVNPSNGVTPVLGTVKIAIPQGYFPEGVTTAKVHLPGKNSVNANITNNAQGDSVITVNNLGVWGIIELAH
ncbi:carbohydrate-binding protein [Colwellia sp. E2M01]|uniref:carbohydrate-binding protein n=1 Tax=Colwellia sp. E2M01 TaxID=2841561 RepID=UPI001C09E07E|nr:carbohydrate-binding protein [Colwellia sp. E2M01]MBU2872078.1 carbohydrate-binding protein [Colwellia sp. E2M01]